jgi:3-methyladenine DNA glycosylase AlkD
MRCKANRPLPPDDRAPMTHPLVRALRAALREAGDPRRAPRMQAYMKSPMPYRGVAAPALKRIVKDVLAAHQLESFEEWSAVALDLWRSARFREERYGAIALTGARAYRAFNTFAAVPVHEEMIVSGAWWDYVDAIATHQIGDVLRGEPRRTTALLRRWARDRVMWKRRAAILAQIGFKADTDLDLMYGCIDVNMSDRDFFIRKAIGWALRQYAWTDGREVARYVRANRGRLSPLSVREALKNIGRGT